MERSLGRIRGGVFSWLQCVLPSRQWPIDVSAENESLSEALGLDVCKPTSGRFKKPLAAFSS